MHAWFLRGDSPDLHQAQRLHELALALFAHAGFEKPSHGRKFGGQLPIGERGWPCIDLRLRFRGGSGHDRPRNSILDIWQDRHPRLRQQCYWYVGYLK